MYIFLVIVLSTVVVSQSSIDVPPLQAGEADVTTEFADVVIVKLAEALHRLSLQLDGIPMAPLHIFRVSRRTGVGDLHIIARIRPHPGLCKLILHEEPPSDNQRLDISCGAQKWHVSRGSPRRKRDDYELTDEEAHKLDAKVTAGLEQLKFKQPDIPLTLGEILSVDKWRRDERKGFSIRAFLGDPPRPCTIELLERSGTDDDFVVVCKQLRLRTVLKPGRVERLPDRRRPSAID